MDNITVEYFLTLFEEFKRIAQPKIKVYIGIATGRVPTSVWGANTQYATALLTAHMLTLQGKGGGGEAGGPLTQESVGDLSRSFATIFQPGAGDAPYMTTRYGVEFIELRRETIVSAMVSGGRRGSGCC